MIIKCIKINNDNTTRKHVKRQRWKEVKGAILHNPGPLRQATRSPWETRAWDPMQEGLTCCPLLLLGSRGWWMGLGRSEHSHKQQQNVSCNWDNKRPWSKPSSNCIAFYWKKTKRNKQKKGAWGTHCLTGINMFSLGSTLPQSLEGLGVSFHIHLHHLASCDAQMLFGVTRSCPPIEDGLWKGKNTTQN